MNRTTRKKTTQRTSNHQNKEQQTEQLTFCEAQKRVAHKGSSIGSLTRVWRDPNFEDSSTQTRLADRRRVAMLKVVVFRATALASS